MGGYFNPKRCPRICLAFRESDVDPRFCAMNASDQNDVLHPVDSQTKLSCPGEPAVNMLGYPLAEISQ
jgi:hypothetical protein